MKEVRGGGASAGYISSGFFGGLTLGRVALLWLNKLVRGIYDAFLRTPLTTIIRTGWRATCHLCLRRDRHSVSSFPDPLRTRKLTLPL